MTRAIDPPKFDDPKHRTRHRGLSGAVALIVVACVLLPQLAFAHIGQGDVGGGFLAGVRHPVSGLDHIVAMVAVGIWGSQLGKPAIWILPVTFPLVMAFGGALGVLGIPFFNIEVGIALSAIVLGAMVALALRLPLWVAGVIVAFFALCHGYAHGAELPDTANAIAYALGFVLATGTLHVFGIVIGTLGRWPAGAAALRGVGVVIAACGVYFMLPHVTGA